MNPTERVLRFECEGQQMVGVLGMSDRPGDTAVLIVVGGPQYRVGSHRQFVSLSRVLAGAGFPTFRFDVRGMGDSQGTPRGFEHIGADIGAALDALLCSLPSVRRVVLWGLCDGASACLLYLHERSDPRIGGLVLVNPWVRSAQTQARTRVKHYYLDRIRNREFWCKLVRGGVGISSMLELARNLFRAWSTSQGPGDPPKLSYQHRMARAWAAFSGPILLLMSEQDYTAREFDEALRSDPLWGRALTRLCPCRVDLAGADHTCSDPSAQAALEQATSRWLREKW